MADFSISGTERKVTEVELRIVYEDGTEERKTLDGPVHTISIDADIDRLVVTGDVLGEMSVRGDLECNDIHGGVTANGDITCNDISGSASSGADINCNDIGGDVQAGGDVTCNDISGSVSAGGDVIEDDLEEDDFDDDEDYEY